LDRIVLVIAFVLVGCGGKRAFPTCANVGCGAPPLCSEGCRATCGCCSCTPGDRQGDLVCTNGCYAPAPPVDASADASPDGGWTPPSACALPFDPGPCDASIPVYAFVGSTCAPSVYGGCQGNANRFRTLEECLGTCEGRPVPNGCPAGRIARAICLACGPAGGCATLLQSCALPCDGDGGTCSGALPFCFDGVCQYGGCE
jgi:hypothetical protein